MMIKLTGFAAVCVIMLLGVAHAKAGPSATDILKATGVKGGLVVHLGCGDGTLTAKFRAGDSYLVHGLAANAKDLDHARGHVRSLGLYGPVSIRAFDGEQLPYIANLVNLLVAEDLGDVPMDEVMRVLAPLGVAYVKSNGVWAKTVKPWPTGIDEWQQYLHDADNNAVARDTVVGPPRHLQWVTGPGWSRSHMAIPTVTSMVSSKGRLFSIEDTATVEHPFLPGEFKLVARDAFNGVILWTRSFPDWEPITRYVKDIAIQSQRRLAVIDDIVYCTPGLFAPLTALDAATGSTRKVYDATAQTQEFAYHQGILYAVVGDRMNAARYNIVKPMSGKGTNLGGSDPQAPFGGTGFRGAYAPQSEDKADPVCSIVAIDADSGKELWRENDIRGYVGCTLAIKGDYAVYQKSTGMVCVNPKTGQRIWSVDKDIHSSDGTEANPLILSDSMVYAKEGTSLVAYSIEDGKEKWKGSIANNYEKAADFFLAADFVWTGGSKQPTACDPKTGATIKTIPQVMKGPMGHDRCYRNFITEQFYINSKTGGADFLDLATSTEFPNHWTRGTCGMGVLPCNGLLYVPPYSCQCSIGAMIKDFNAMYAEKGLKSSDQKIKVVRQARLEQGPAYGKPPDPGPSTLDPRPSPPAPSTDWPTYRHDGARGGATKAAVAARLKPLWSAQVGTSPSSPMIADGTVFLSDTEGHTLHALNASNGEAIWQYTAGGRIDSPPTYYNESVLFGSRDGWVYCLRASDGAVAWRFKDLPDRLIGAFGQLESAWPVSGSVLVQNDTVYFAAGRSSFLDGGIFLYALHPETGDVIHSRQVYGPFDKSSGFPAVANLGFKEDILVGDGDLLYMRHKAFRGDLSDAPAGKPHVLPSAGFLDGNPQHRTYWTIATGFSGKTTVRGPSGDILVTDGKHYYEMRGFPVHRHSYFDPRVKGYHLFAGVRNNSEAPMARDKDAGADKRRGNRKGMGRASKAPMARWNSDVPLTGKAMVLAGDVLFVAGTPASFPPDHAVEKFRAAYAGQLGGVLWAVSTEDGSKLAEYQLEAAPTWDGMAAAAGRLYVSLNDGTLMCLGKP